MRYELPIRSLVSTLFGVGLLTFLLCQRHAGFLVIFEALFVFGFIVQSIWVCFRQPQRRLIQATKVTLWIVSILIVTGYHYYLAKRTQAQAEEIVDAVISYQAKHGVYPKDSEAIGYNESELKSQLGWSAYFLAEGKPIFFYAVTYLPFEIVGYDFSKRKWLHTD